MLFINVSLLRRFRLFFLILLVFFASGSGYASGFGQCSSQFYQQTAPVLLKNSLKSNSYSLCFSGFAVLYSGVSRTPLYSAEYLTTQRLKKARKMKRNGTFRWDIASKSDAPDVVPERYQADLNDYSGSGYDRGHMAPNADMATRQQQSDSFYLANMVPQSPRNNQDVWRHLEEATRALVLKNKSSAYVITGPLFLGNKIGRVGNVLVPTHVYKAVFFPSLNVASAYLTPNDDSGSVQVVSIAELEKLAGMDLFPHLSSQTKQVAVNLPYKAQQIRGARYQFTPIASTGSIIGSQPTAVSSSAAQVNVAQETREGSDLLEKLKYEFLRWLATKLSNL